MKIAFNVQKIAIIFLTVSVSMPTWAQNKKIDVSGRNGQKGEDGRNGSDGSRGWGRGGDGEDGRDGTRGMDGQSAGSVDIKLLPTSFAGSVIIKGEIQTQSSAPSSINGEQNLGRYGKISIDAFGGSGGRGGNGGNGGDGGRGADGDDATRYSSGENGKSGGNGGRGGDAAGGGNGQNGGQVKVSADEDRTDLFMLLGDVNISGGRGGPTGEPGRGGDAGRGGSGGQSHFWTESVYDGTDSEGHAQYRTDFKSNPGGFSGSSGSSGRSGSVQGTRGSDGRDGVFKLVVENKNGTISQYSKRYDLYISSFSLYEDNRDGKFEPGESGYLDGLVIVNPTDMATPKLPVSITLPSGNWLSSKYESFNLPSIPAHGSYRVEKKFHFNLKDTQQLSEGDRFKVTDTVSPKAVQTGVERTYERFAKPSTFEITFPVEITPIHAAMSVLPGQKTQISWQIKNVSDKDFGSVSDLKRHLSTLLKINPSELSTKEFVFRDKEGKEIALDDGFFNEVALLRAGDSVIIKGTVEIKPEALPYTKLHVQSSLTVGHVSRENEKKTIQYRNFMLHISSAYKKTKGSDALIITNDHTDLDEVRAWKSMLEEFGLKADLWDTSYEGYLQFMTNLKENNQSLSRDFSQSIVIVLNNDREHKQYVGKKIQADGMIPKRDILQTIDEYGIKYYFVGKDSKHNQEKVDLFLLPSTDETWDKQVSSLDELVEYIKSRKPQIGNVAKLEWDETYVFTNPKPEHFQKRLKEVQDKLEKTFPGRRFYVLWKYDGAQVSSEYKIFDKHHLGTFEISESISLEKNKMNFHAVSNERMKQMDFIFGPLNQRGFLLSLPINQKLKLFFKYTLNQDFRSAFIADYSKKDLDWYIRSLQEAILYEVAAELYSYSENGITENEDSAFPILKTVLNQLMISQRSILSKNPQSEVINDQGKVTLGLLAQIEILTIHLGDEIKDPVHEIIAACIDQSFGKTQWSKFWDKWDFPDDEFKKQKKKLYESALTQFKEALGNLNEVYRKHYGWFTAHYGYRPLDPLDRALRAFNNSIITKDINEARHSENRNMSIDEYNAYMESLQWYEDQREAFKVRREKEKADVEKISN